VKLEGLPQNVTLRDGTAVVIKPLGVEEASLRVLRSIMVQDGIADANGVYVNVTGGISVHRAQVESVADCFSQRFSSSVQLLYGHRIEHGMDNVTRVTLLATGIPFPGSWGRYRRIPLQLHDLEPDSAEDDGLPLELGLEQMESCVGHFT
jgi:cell division GTPase FtsZ